MTATEDGSQPAVFASLFESYAQACRSGAEVDDGSADDVFEEGVERVKEHLLSAAGEAAACMICLENIRPQDPVWSCQDGCFAVMHLPCIQSWARRALAAAQAKPAPHPMVDPAGAAAAAARGPAAWGCPKCRQDYTAVPSGYTCWCGKVPDPEWNPWNAAHSCGELCDKPAPGCGHPCVLLCHPGPCPPCPRVVSASCFCGAVVTDKRCGRHEFSCGGICGAVLPCGHACPAICHDGECPPCALVSTVPCRCGAEAQQLPCSQQGVFQCTRVCGKPLDCGRHGCEQVCHAGKCSPCALAGPKACPCGKKLLPHAACDVVVPPCGETCGKLLSCGVHRCHERCHTGPCTTVCRETLEKSCECGKTQRTVQCHETFRCERRCIEMRSCGRHQCRRRCCDGQHPACEEVCNKWLKCRNHRCPAPCHSGDCAPCPLSACVSCACSRTHYTVPCGREAAALPPKCSHPCPVPLLCRHAGAAASHRCHFGPCPPCPQACSTQLACGHACSSEHCHDPPPPAVPGYQPPPPPVAPLGPSGSSSGSSKQQRDAAAAAAPAQEAAAEARRLLEMLPRTAQGQLTACPACPALVPVTCRGGHMTVQVPCSAAAPFSCEQRCGRPLACGNHTCQEQCHDAAATPCTQCSLPCQRRRGTCAHPCPLPCHPPAQACPACAVRVTHPCHCGKTTLDFACAEVTAAVLPPAALRCGKTCHRALPGCPHTCERPCHEGPCTSQGCATEVTVRCGCKRSKRKLPCSEVQRLLATATGSAAYDSTTSLRLLPCDASCAKAAAADEGKGGGDAPVARAAGSNGATAAAAALPAAAAAAGSGTEPAKPRKLSKEEKQAEREAARQARLAAQQRKQRQQAAVLTAILSLLVLLALGVRHLLVWLDQRAQAAWGLEQHGGEL
ncbi:hypothetical protein ABPG75_002126 [Micractinium tetrahymenae]